MPESLLNHGTIEHAQNSVGPATTLAAAITSAMLALHYAKTNRSPKKAHELAKRSTLNGQYTWFWVWGFSLYGFAMVWVLGVGVWDFRMPRKSTGSGQQSSRHQRAGSAPASEHEARFTPPGWGVVFDLCGS